MMTKYRPFEELPVIESELRAKGFEEDHVRTEIMNKTLTAMEEWKGKSRVGKIIASHTAQQQIAVMKN